MDPIMSSLMDRASVIELRVAEIYDTFSKLFDSDPALSRFWALFSEEERYHSLILQLQKHLLNPATASQEDLAEWEKDIATMMVVLDGWIDRLKSGAWNPTVPEAFSVADQIEDQVLEAQAYSFRLVDESEAGEIVARLHEEDARHRDKLLQARERFDPSYSVGKGQRAGKEVTPGAGAPDGKDEPDPAGDDHTSRGDA